MQTLRVKAHVGEDGHLHVDVQTNLPAGNVEAVLVLSQPEEMQKKKARYDFKDLAGSLQWRGNAVEEQRKLRDEWR